MTDKEKRKPLILVKIGGSLITDKNKPFSLKKKALETIALEVKRAMGEEVLLVVGHGAGSFAHVPAKKYQTKAGFIDEESRRGMVEVADVAAQLNRIVVKELIGAKVDAVSMSPLTMMTAEDFELKRVCTDSIEQVLSKGLLPVVYGDVVMDEAKGWTIFSTERVLGYLAIALKEKGYDVQKIIHCGQTNGVYDLEGQTIPLITPTSIGQYKRALNGSGGTDVTGGMIHKVEEALRMAEQGIPGLIIDGIEHGSLAAAIAEKPVVGTRVEVAG
jgi:isopentenyl phosphate kinase